MAKSCHLCFCPQILHHDAHVQGNNQSISMEKKKKKAKQTKGRKWCITSAPPPLSGLRKQKQRRPNRSERARACPVGEEGVFGHRRDGGVCWGGNAKHNSALSCFVASSPWNDCFTQMNRLNTSCMFAVDRNKSFKSAFPPPPPFPPHPQQSNFLTGVFLTEGAVCHKFTPASA